MFIAVVYHVRANGSIACSRSSLERLRTYEIEEGVYVETTTAATPYDKSAETG